MAVTMGILIVGANLSLDIACLIFLVHGLFAYRRYYNRLRTKHSEEFTRLNQRDRIMADAGDWIRWPVGSAWVILSAFDWRSSLADDELARSKKAVRRSLGISVSLLLLAVLVGIWASHMPT